MSITHLFNSSCSVGQDKPSYSTTEHDTLSSTTFSLGGGDYCIHCGSKARYIQRGGMMEGYADMGKRCNCDAAMNEMATLLALDMGEFDRQILSFRSVNQVPNDITRKVIDSKKTIDMHMFTYGNNGKICQGDVDSGYFLRENKHEIKFNLHDDWHKEDPFVLFMQLVIKQFQLFSDETKKHHAKKEAQLNDILVGNNLTKNSA